MNRYRYNTPIEEPLIVQYFIDQSLWAITEHIEAGMHQIEDYSRIEFLPMNYNSRDFLYITSGLGCECSPYSLGNLLRNRNRRRPKLELSENCRHRGRMLHELMHAIGFEHEHQRPDRNRHITINWPNIGREDSNLFQKLENSHYFWDTSRFAFDYASVMLFGEYEFSKNGRKTLQSKDRSSWRVPTQLSRKDKDKLSLL